MSEDQHLRTCEDRARLLLPWARSVEIRASADRLGSGVILGWMTARDQHDQPHQYRWCVDQRPTTVDGWWQAIREAIDDEDHERITI